MIQVSEGNSVTFSDVPQTPLSSENLCQMPGVISLSIYSISRVPFTHPMIVPHSFMFQMWVILNQKYVLWNEARICGVITVLGLFISKSWFKT